MGSTGAAETCKLLNISQHLMLWGGDQSAFQQVDFFQERLFLIFSVTVFDIKVKTQIPTDLLLLTCQLCEQEVVVIGHGVVVERHRACNRRQTPKFHCLDPIIVTNKLTNTYIKLTSTMITYCFLTSDHLLNSHTVTV